MPLATYTGWNFRNRAIGGPTLLVSLLGSRIPLASMSAQAAANHDPRKSIADRYASRDAYLASAKQATETLVRGGYLLAQDVEQVMLRMQAQWDAVARGTN